MPEEKEDLVPFYFDEDNPPTPGQEKLWKERMGRLMDGVASRQKKNGNSPSSESSALPVSQMAQTILDNPGLTEEKYDEMSKAFGF